MVLYGVCQALHYFNVFCFFFFNDTATTEIYTLSLHDALPIYPAARGPDAAHGRDGRGARQHAARRGWQQDRKSTRLNSSHSQISYAVFCLKKKKKTGSAVVTCMPCAPGRRRADRTNRALNSDA